MGSFGVSVVDTTPPAITVPAPITAEATGPAGAAVTYSATASDLVDGAVPVTCVPPSGSTFALGTTTVTCGATDAHGNSASATFTVTVVDTTPPAITTSADLTSGPTGPMGATIGYGAASAIDLVDGAVSVVCLPVSGTLFGFGTTTVSCSATDAAGNTGTATFSVTVTGYHHQRLLPAGRHKRAQHREGWIDGAGQVELFGQGGVEITSTAAVMSGWPKIQRIDCGSLGALPEDAIETTSTGGTSLRYDSTGGQFIYNWQTPRQPSTCWRLDVTFQDGVTRSATFKLK